jgi:hypothetical protein
MATVDKYLKELKNLVPMEEASIESKLKFINTQLDAYQIQAYRCVVDVKVAKRYIKVGEELNEESYVTTGENNIKEAVQNLRSIVVYIQKLVEERELLKKEQEYETSSNPTE